MRDYIKAKERTSLSLKELAHLSSVAITHEELRFKEQALRMEALEKQLERTQKNIRILTKKL